MFEFGSVYDGVEWPNQGEAKGDGGGDAEGRNNGSVDGTGGELESCCISKMSVRVGDNDGCFVDRVMVPTVEAKGSLRRSRNSFNGSLRSLSTSAIVSGISIILSVGKRP